MSIAFVDCCLFFGDVQYFCTSFVHLWLEFECLRHSVHTFFAFLIDIDGLSGEERIEREDREISREIGKIEREDKERKRGRIGRDTQIEVEIEIGIEIEIEIEVEIETESEIEIDVEIEVEVEIENDIEIDVEIGIVIENEIE